MTVLIIGGESAIGTALTQHLTKTGISVKTTSRRRDTEHSLWIDLAEDESVNNFQLPDVAGCVILASVTSMSECETSQEKTHRINVYNTIKLITKLQQKGIFTVFLSSNQVFDAYSLHNSPRATLHPLNNYGRMKLEVENFINQNCSNAAILRLGKVIGESFPLLENFIDELTSGRSVSAYKNYTVAPTSMTLCCKAITGLLFHRAQGIYQVSSAMNISYFELVKHVCGLLKIDIALINPGLMVVDGNTTPINNAVMETNIERVIELEQDELSIDASLIDILPILKASLINKA